MIEQYKAALQNVQPGYGADVFLAEGEEKRFVRRNLKAAAAEQNIGVEFRPVKDPSRIHMRFISLEEQAARPRRPGGRPRKSAPPPVGETAAAAGTAPGRAAVPPAEEPARSAPPKRRRPRKAAASARDGV